MLVLEKIYHDNLVIQELRQSVLGKYIDDFALYLQELGYAKKQFRSRLTVIRKLNTWLTKNNISLYDLNQEKLNQFIKLRASQSTTFLRHGDRKIISYFIDYLRLKKVIPQSIPVIPENESTENIIQAYAKYLDEDKGLCALTIIRNKKVIYDFLYKNFGKNKFIPKKITQSLILLYIIKFKDRHALKSLQVMVSIIRSFLRYLVMVGKLSVELANCIPAISGQRAANLPVFLVKSETKKLLRICDRRTSKGRRNYAILFLLMRLGLREHPRFSI